MAWQKRKSVDKNQLPIVWALRAAGATVIEMNGDLDLLVGYNGKNIIMEVKNKDGKDRLTDKQRALLEEWRGDKINIVYTPEEALGLLRFKKGV